MRGRDQGGFAALFPCTHLPVVAMSVLLMCSSSVVQLCLIDAHRSGKKFKVVVVNSRPKMEGMYIIHTCIQTEKYLWL